MRTVLTRLILVCMYLIVAGLMSPASFAEVDPGICMGAWLFDRDGSEIEEDITGNGNDGVIMGNPKWADGKFGSALDCDGVDDYVDCGDKDSLDVGTSDFSIVAWIKCAKYTPAGWRDNIVNKLDTVAPRRGYTLSVRGALDPDRQDNPVCILGLASTSGVNVFGTKPINDDTWHHLAATVDRDGFAILYRDGEVEAQTNIAATSKENEDNAKSFNIGAASGSDTIQSLIDEVAIFSVVLTQDEIKRIMTGGIERALGITAVSSEDRIAVTWGSIRAKYW